METRRPDGQDAGGRAQVHGLAGARHDRRRRMPRRTIFRRSSTQQKGGFKLEPWDWQFYAEQVRKAKYDLDESQIKPYFELNNVLRERRVLRREPAVRHHVQGAQGHSRSTSRMCACSRCSTPTASRWRSSTATTSSATTRTAAPGWTASSTSRSCWARSRWSSTSRTSRSPRRASRRC